MKEACCSRTKHNNHLFRVHLQRLHQGAPEVQQTEEELFLKQLFMRETVFARAKKNNGCMTDEALCRYDKIHEIANEQYVNVMLY